MSTWRTMMLALPAGALLAGCVSDPAGIQPVAPVPSTKGVYIVNEGNFGRGNSTLSYYDASLRVAYQDVFQAVNKRPLGDVGNAIVVRNGRVYIVVNNSHRIEILDQATNISAGSIMIGGGRSPRQMAFMNDSLALVTCLYDASALQVNVRSMAVVKRIPVGPNPDGIAITRGKAYVANSGLSHGSTVSVIDLTSLTVVRTLVAGDNPVEVAVTSMNMVYVLCAGFYGDMRDPEDDTPASIAVIDPGTNELVQRITVGTHAYRIAMGAGGVGYVPTTEALVALDTRQHRSLGVFLEGGFYGVALDPETDDVYVSDARNYVQPGLVSVYTASRQLRTQFTVGINPGSFAFKL